MKKIFAIIIALIGFIFSACNDWLDVNPRKSKKMFYRKRRKDFGMC
jgi:hypothetical protein